jgi:hypothetical protein
LRDKAVAARQHSRTPGIVADLAIGLRYFLDFALEIGAIESDRRADLARRGWRALEEAAEQHASHLAGAEPCGQFLRFLVAALASGRAHVAAPDGGEPNQPEAWGWRIVTFGAGMNERSQWQPSGRRIGWTERDAVYLEPEAAFAEAQHLAGEQGESLAVSSRILWRRLREKNLLAGWDESRQRNQIRPAGLERISASAYFTKGLRKSDTSGAAKSDALDPTLQELIDAWPKLPQEVRCAILVMVRAAIAK